MCTFENNLNKIITDFLRIDICNISDINSILPIKHNFVMKNTLYFTSKYLIQFILNYQNIYTPVKVILFIIFRIILYILNINILPLIKNFHMLIHIIVNVFIKFNYYNTSKRLKDILIENAAVYLFGKNINTLSSIYYQLLLILVDDVTDDVKLHNDKNRSYKILDYFVTYHTNKNKIKQLFSYKNDNIIIFVLYKIYKLKDDDLVEKINTMINKYYMISNADKVCSDYECLHKELYKFHPTIKNGLFNNYNNTSKSVKETLFVRLLDDLLDNIDDKEEKNYTFFSTSDNIDDKIKKFIIFYNENISYNNKLKDLLVKMYFIVVIHHNKDFISEELYDSILTNSIIDLEYFNIQNIYKIISNQDLVRLLIDDINYYIN
jgi:hypothetical protein